MTESTVHDLELLAAALALPSDRWRDCPTCKGGGEVCEIPRTSWMGRPERNPENAVCGPCPDCHGDGAVEVCPFCGQPMSGSCDWCDGPPEEDE